MGGTDGIDSRESLVKNWKTTFEKHDWKRHTHPRVHGITIYNSQDMEAKRPGREKCAKTHVHTYNGMILSYKTE